MTNEDKELTVQEAAELYGIDESTIRRAINEKRLTPSRQVGKKSYLIRASEMRRYYDEKVKSGKGRPFHTRELSNS